MLRHGSDLHQATRNVNSGEHTMPCLKHSGAPMLHDPVRKLDTCG